MRHIINLIVLILITLTFVACGGRTAGGDGNDNLNNSNENVNQNNNQPDYLTRKVMVINTASEVMDYALDLGPCSENYSDVDGQSGHDTTDQFLCWGLQIMHKRAAHAEMPNGEFGPEMPVLKSEAWRTVSYMLGFPYWGGSNCGAPDINRDEWYSGFAGAMCEKDLIQLAPDGLAHPGDFMLMAEWYALLSDLEEYFSRPATREYVTEALVTILLQDMLEETCESIFADVLSDTLLCSVTNALVDKGLLDPAQINFRPNDTATWAEVIKLAANAANIPESQCSGCSGLTNEHWVCGWADALCEAGYLPDNFDANETPSLLEVYQLFWDLQMAQIPVFPSY